jgi:hypothetical protein
MVYPLFLKNVTSYNMSCSWENCMLDLFMIHVMSLKFKLDFDDVIWHSAEN